MVKNTLGPQDRQYKTSISGKGSTYLMHCTRYRMRTEKWDEENPAKRLFEDGITKQVEHRITYLINTCLRVLSYLDRFGYI